MTQLGSLIEPIGGPGAAPPRGRTRTGACPSLSSAQRTAFELQPRSRQRRGRFQPEDTPGRVGWRQERAAVSSKCWLDSAAAPGWQLVVLVDRGGCEHGWCPHQEPHLVLWHPGASLLVLQVPSVGPTEEAPLPKPHPWAEEVACQRERLTD